MTPQISCPWWCDDHRTGETLEDEQHARIFPTPEGSWIAILSGVLSSDHLELAYGIEAYDQSPERALCFAQALAEATGTFERIRDSR